MTLQNIYNKNRLIYLFCRDENGNLSIKEDNSFHPYFYEIDSHGTYQSYDGKKLRKVICSKPSDVPKIRSDNSYESDILFKRRYMIDKIDKLDKSPIKCCFIDIEVLTDELPNVDKAEFPISCISIYNSFTKGISVFYLGDYPSEYEMISSFIQHMQKESYDLWLSWNLKFDYNYLANRFPDFAKEISPIKEIRYGDGIIYYPAGISLVDYLSLFRKVFMREFSYSLDYIAEKHLGKGKTYKPDFAKLSPEIIKRNREDIEIMVKLEEKTKLIPYYDEIRRFGKIEWEDLIFNSRVIESLLFDEAKKRKIVLPNKARNNSGDTYKGATREVKKLGLSFDVGKCDLSGAYPQIMIDFCLDPSNIVHEKETNSLQIENSYFIQNPNTLLPNVAKRLLIEKNKLRKQKKDTSPNSSEYKDISIKYNAIKGLANSAYGVFGNRYFRMYSQDVASATTSLVRDALLYVVDKLEKMGISVSYLDTDSVFYNSKEDLSDILNDLIKQWGKEKYDKDVNIEFEFEGFFKSILIVALCRYKGYLQTKTGIKTEIKGLEIKRNDSSSYIKFFQNELIEKILNKETEEQVLNWVKSEMERIKTIPIEEIAFPVKIQRRNYKNVPIFLRASNNSEKYGFKTKIGEPFYYIYVIPKERDKDGKPINVLAFKKNEGHFIEDVDWNEMIRRNILMKTESIFNAMDWKLDIILEKIPNLLKNKPIIKQRKSIDKEPNQIKFKF